MEISRQHRLPMLPPLGGDAKRFIPSYSTKPAASMTEKYMSVTQSRIRTSYTRSSHPSRLARQKPAPVENSTNENEENSLSKEEIMTESLQRHLNDITQIQSELSVFRKTCMKTPILRYLFGAIRFPDSVQSRIRRARCSTSSIINPGSRTKSRSRYLEGVIPAKNDIMKSMKGKESPSVRLSREEIKYSMNPRAKAAMIKGYRSNMHQVKHGYNMSRTKYGL